MSRVLFTRSQLELAAEKVIGDAVGIEKRERLNSPGEIYVASFVTQIHQPVPMRFLYLERSGETEMKRELRRHLALQLLHRILCEAERVEDRMEHGLIG